MSAVIFLPYLNEAVKREIVAAGYKTDHTRVVKWMAVHLDPARYAMVSRGIAARSVMDRCAKNIVKQMAADFAEGRRCV